MAIKVGGTTVVDDARQLSNIASVDATTVTALSNAGVGGGGGSIDIVADEDISAGVPVVLASNGNASLAASVAATTVQQPDDGSKPIYKNFDDTNKHVSVYIPQYDYFVAIYVEVPENDKVRYSTYRVSGDTAAITQLQEPLSTGMDDAVERPIRAYYDADSNQIIGLSEISSKLHYFTATPNADGTVSFTAYHTEIDWGVNASMTYDPVGERLVVVYRNPVDSYDSYYVVGTIGNASVTWSNPTSLGAGIWDENVDITCSPSGTLVVVFRSPPNSNQGYARTGSLNPSTNVITWGAMTLFSSSSTFGVSVDYDTTNDVAVFAYFNDTSNTLEARAASISGSSLIVGSVQTVLSSIGAAGIDNLDIRVDKNSGAIFLFYRNNATSRAEARISSISSGTTINTFSNQETFSNSVPEHVNVETGNGYAFLLFRRNGSFGEYSATVVSTANTSSFLGVAAEAITSGNTGEVTILSGVNESVTGLTPGSTYYVDKSGSFTTSTGQLVGRALASNKILITGMGS